ncbi:hypothetical protein KOI35_42845 [Actinoplanes bogorensis]|uniref:WXG100 family type VII secretion target n=1 Tax=Paractinoplanes bogorensis TaxID=1610840 RepID=A0ABS5Z3Z1_9ACTN|nr:hypothetical protein [Actinoplanes bogorensis]MBU2670261.1 hypothetical protein [Actinoplanes bogorensis]
MTQPRGRLYVNPDGVVSVGDAYGEHVQIYDTYLANLVSLRERYSKAWGNDDMGQQFSTKFLAGLDNLESLIGGVKGTLQYTAEGLQSFGKAYAEADESAKEVGRQMQGDFEESFAPKARRAVAAPPAPVEGAEGEPLQALRRTRVAALPLESSPDEGQPLMRAMRSTRMAVEAPELEPTHTFARSVRAEAASPMMPAISSMMLKPEYTTALVGGEALPEGYRLQALNPFPDGTTRVDANLYESITPLSGTTVTTPDGQPIEPDGRQLFVVKDNPAADATQPGYQPLVLSYAPDGTPSPLIPGDA